MQIRLQGIIVRNISTSSIFFGVLICLGLSGCVETKTEKVDLATNINSTLSQLIEGAGNDPDSVLNLVESGNYSLDSNETIYIRAYCYLYTNNTDKALAQLEILLNKSIGNDSLNNVAKKLKSLAQYFAGDYRGFIYSSKELSEIHLARGNLVAASKAFSNASTGFHELGEFDSALIYQNEAFELAKRSGDTPLIEFQHRDFVPILLELGLLDSAQVILGEYLNQPGISKLDKFVNLINYGSIFNKRKEYEKSKEVYLDAIKIAFERGDSLDITLVLHNIAYANYHLGNYKRAFIQLDSVVDIRKRNQEFEISKRIEELQLKYEDLEKDAQLTELASQTEADRTFKIWLSIVSVLVISILGFFYVSNRNRLRNLRRIREEEKKRFQKEKELAALHSSLQALEEERKRVAMDLHDGIGVLASAARLRVSQVNKRIDDATLNKILNETDEVLNTITGDVRRIAHNIMPATLSKLGLKTAIEELLEKSPQSMDIEFRLKLEEVQLPKAKPHDITLYRICQELVNNALKHSQSTLVEISLTQKGNLVILRYDDNGVGLSDKNGTGSGLDAMKSRIESLGGRMFVDKSSKTGTHIYFEVSNG